MSVGRTAIVTGAASLRGIGRRTGDKLAAEGWALAILDIDGDAAEAAAAEIATRHGVEARGHRCDVTSERDVEQAFAAVETTLPPVGALVNNAGITSPTRFAEVSIGEWERVMRVNVHGSFLATRRAMPGMVARGFGRVVMLSSVSAERGGGVFGGVAYSAAKAALLGFARALAREVGPHGVTVNSVAPGLIDTDITAGKLNPERRARLIAEIPVNRSGTTDDVADVVAFLCRPSTAFVTGATWDINGGSHIH
ncbi:SDR family NAD(P)-dependent oxidoreductase [Lichenicoccus sp.]|uniref:SDR family NAD(P)-dependent oxidoreductase n=1 Tax=Lichenicoccus sp. TaxID=2781899 RepID=UPI003D0C7635